MISKTFFYVTHSIINLLARKKNLYEHFGLKRTATNDQIEKARNEYYEIFDMPDYLHKSR